MQREKVRVYALARELNIESKDLLDIPADDLIAVTVAAQRIARATVDQLGADGVNLLNSCGTAAWQTVFHFHLHVVPRYEGDTVLPGCVWGMPPWQPPPNSPAERRRAAEKLRAGLV